jgi:hypothetical protein
MGSPLDGIFFLNPSALLVSSVSELPLLPESRHDDPAPSTGAASLRING